MGQNAFLKQIWQKTGFSVQISNCYDLSESKSNRAFKISTIIEFFATCTWCGVNRFKYTELSHHDNALGKILDWEQI